MRRPIRSRPAGYTAAEFLQARAFDELGAELGHDLFGQRLPDGIRIRRVADLSSVPQARTDFTQGGASRTTITTIAIDHAAGRRGT